VLLLGGVALHAPRYACSSWSLEGDWCEQLLIDDGAVHRSSGSS
jgi:hypothetical protein